MRVGLISDTHGLLRPEALAYLAGCDHIIHGGDIGNAAILDQLAALAPLSVVRGNNDSGPWARDLPETLLLHFDAVAVYAIHDFKALPVDPGSAGRRRFSLPIAAAELIVDGAQVRANIAMLAP
jgi:putative phosphoesterase